MSSSPTLAAGGPEGGWHVATYISLMNFTQQGIASIKEGPGRLDAGKETLKAFGSELKAFYLTMGRYDIVAISEAPDDEARDRGRGRAGEQHAEGDRE